jgi:quercetin dioxygenase-like cupin family protein
MKIFPIVPILVASFALLLSAGIATQEEPRGQTPALREVVVVSPEKAEFKEVLPGISRAIIVGNPEKGPYRAFTKFDSGVTHELHAHPNDIDLVVLTGTYIYKPEKGDEIRVPAGSYLHIPANDRHASSADAKLGVLFFEESSGPFGVATVPR